MNELEQVAAILQKAPWIIVAAVFILMFTWGKNVIARDGNLIREEAISLQRAEVFVEMVRINNQKLLDLEKRELQRDRTMRNLEEQNTEVLNENTRLIKENRELVVENTELHKQQAQWETEKEALEARVAELEAEVAGLRKRVGLPEKPKTGPLTEKRDEQS